MRPTRRNLARQRDTARAGRELAIEQRDDARDDRDAALLNQRRMAVQLEELRDERDALLKGQATAAGPAPAGWEAERSGLLRRLQESEEARGRLDAQCRDLGRINDLLNREAQDRAEAAR